MKKKWLWEEVITFAAGKFHVATMKNHVHMNFAISRSNKDEINLFQGSGKTMRNYMKIPALKAIEQKKLVRVTELIDKNAICKPG